MIIFPLKDMSLTENFSYNINFNHGNPQADGCSGGIISFNGHP